MSNQSFRTHTCGALRKEHVGQNVTLAGWLRNRRDHGGITFVDLADHYGVTQMVIDPQFAGLAEVNQTPKESVIQIQGNVVARTENTINAEMPTGTIEVQAREFTVLGIAEPLPFSVFPEAPIPEDLRLKYRYLDLRRSKVHGNMVLRSRVISSIRRRMEALGFAEFQTPTLTSSSPEGARDYLVISRRHPGKCYALPQAPQQFKQLLMIAGFDRYFQIANCYRDEDARADRSPGEFYQLDLEMSFVTQDEVFSTVEILFKGLFEEFAPGTVVQAPFPRLTYDEAMLRYASDKPDLRNPTEIVELSDLFEKSGFTAFAGKTVRAILAPNGSTRPRSFFDKLEDAAKKEGAPGLAWLTLQADGILKGPLVKFLTEEQRAVILERSGAQKGDALFFVAGERPLALKILHWLRKEICEQFKLQKADQFLFCWVVDFPFYERDDEGLIQFNHNPFSMPQGGLESLNRLNPLEVKAHQYDIVCNGVELSSGAIRNHDPAIMYRAFEIVGYTREEVDQKFGALVRALKHGAPPHGGIAPGIDRMVMLLAGESNIREVIPFPQNQNAEDLLMGAPSTPTPKQLRELRIRFVPES